MNLVKWMRKNNRQLMAVVVVLIMIAFVGGYGLQELLTHMGGGPGGIAGHYMQDERVTGADIVTANTELKVLRSLFAAEWLRNKQTIFQSPDFKARLLGQLLFPDAQAAAMTSVEMYQAMAQGQLDVTGRQIDAFFDQARGRSEIYWILLRAEARRAGCTVSRSQAKMVLQQQIAGPQAAQVLDSVITNYHMPEDQVLRLFGDLLGVMAYAEMVTSNESLTTGELRAATGRSGERLSAELVKFAAADFVADQNEPAEATLAAQFEQYKDVAEGQVTDKNPYGFGYKLPTRAQLEYLIISNEDVEALIQQPTSDDMERYFARNIASFQEEVKTDPDNPDSPTKKVSKSYAEVAEQIRGILIEDRRDRLANVIINNAMELTDAGFAGMEMERAKSADLQAAAVDYAKVASKLSEQFKISVHTGKTGMLSMKHLSGDRHLGTLAMEGQSRLPVGLPKIVFSVDELGVTELGRFEVAKPRMWENIGPLRDRFGALLAVVRVTDAAKAETPANLDVRYSIQGAVVDATDASEDAVHSVRTQVADDCKLLAAMETSQSRAQAFVQLLSEKTWTEAVDAYNEQFARQNDANPFAARRLRSEKLSNRMRTAQHEIEQMQERFADNPMAVAYIQNLVEAKYLNDRLFTLLGDNRKEAKDLNSLMAFEPGAAFYVVKDLTRTEVTQDDYRQTKAIRALQINAARSESLGLIHYKPDNILARMAFDWVQQDEPDAAAPEEASL
ncbi:MAG: hypothetical protein IH624_12280 [Phycisphaerae bacterium]|nr:hypothetical protein [Phycisphaerae bacterium]